jgi:GDP-4-dehydro-6-deoxy-D-mannose reductase
MARALVTGGSGFVGQWLCRALVRAGWSVTATTIDDAPEPGTLTAEEVAQVSWRGMDLREGVDRRTTLGLLDRVRPDAIFHLAAVAFVPAAGDDPMRALDTNVGATVRLVEAMRQMRASGTADPHLLVVGSAEQYGRHDASDMPLTERHECRPRTFYAATKMAQEHFALAAARADGLRVVATRSFNHSGPGQSPRFLLPALVARVLAARRKPGTPIAIGNTETVRDFLHVEDVVGAYIALVAKGRAGEVYNVCSGEGASVGTLAAEVLSRAGVDSPLVSDATLQRAVDVPQLVGDNAKLRADTGWAPARSRTDIIDDLLDAAP